MGLVLVAIKFLGVPGLIVVGMLIFYEGLPLGPLRLVPYLGPALAEYVDGRVDHERNNTRDAILAEARARALALIEKRNADNAEISSMDTAGLCAELGGRWVPNENRCD